MNQYLREEYHQLQDILWGSGYGRLYSGIERKRLSKLNLSKKHNLNIQTRFSYFLWKGK